METVIMLVSFLGLVLTFFLAFFVYQFVRYFIPQVNKHLIRHDRKPLPRWLCAFLPLACALAVLI